jgi:hypothetical protein
VGVVTVTPRRIPILIDDLREAERRAERIDERLRKVEQAISAMKARLNLTLTFLLADLGAAITLLVQHR